MDTNLGERIEVLGNMFGIIEHKADMCMKRIGEFYYWQKSHTNMVDRMGLSHGKRITNLEQEKIHMEKPIESLVHGAPNATSNGENREQLRTLTERLEKLEIFMQGVPQ